MKNKPPTMLHPLQLTRAWQLLQARRILQRRQMRPKLPPHLPKHPLRVWRLQQFDRHLRQYHQKLAEQNRQHLP